MSRSQERILIKGDAGNIETVIDFPEQAIPDGVPDPAQGKETYVAASGESHDAARGRFHDAARGIALVAHPHPLYGGTLDNKVAQTLAWTFTELGCVALRPNFRGVGASEGAHDHGNGETEDMLRVAGYAEQRFGSVPLVLAGFSFGGYVQTRVGKRLAALNRSLRMVLVAPGIGLVSAGRSYPAENVPADTILIHGDQDDTVPLANVLDWARPQELPVTVIPGADHFFHRRLPIIKAIIKRQWH